MIVKAIARPPRDLMDLEALLRTSPAADLERRRFTTMNDTSPELEARVAGRPAGHARYRSKG